MGQVLEATVPVFLVVALGYVATRAGVFRAQEMDVLNRFVVRIALPLLVFLSLAGRSLAEVTQPAYLATYGLSALAMFAIAHLWARRSAASGTHAAFLGLAMGGTSNGVVGMALFLITVPDVAALAVSMDMLVDNILIIPLALFLAERSARASDGASWRTVTTALGRALRHPIVVALIAALSLSALGLALPAVATDGVRLLAQASSGVGLFAIGGMLTQLDLRTTGGTVAAAIVVKLLAMPTVALALVFALEAIGLPALSPDLKAAAVLTAALPTFTILPALASTYEEGEWSTAAMMGSTALFFVTMTGWMALLVQLGWL